MKRRKWLGMLLAVMMTLGSLLYGFDAPVNAQGTGREVDAKITNFTILNSEKKETNKMYASDSFYLSIEWDASSHGGTLHKGDYFKMKLPDKMIFPADSAHVDFDLYAPDGKTVIGKAHVTPGANGGGEVKVTFTDYVENKQGVHGAMFMAARFDETKLKVGEQNTFQIEVNGKVSSKTVEIIGAPDIENETLTKWSYGQDSDPNAAVWEGRINHRGDTLHDVEISDTLGDSGQTFIEGSFSFKKVKFDKKGKIIEKIEDVNLNDKLTFSPDKKSYTIKLGNVNGDQYFFDYKTTYAKGTTLKNKIQLKSTEKSAEFIASYKSSESGGSGVGELANKIKIIRVDSENEQTKLENAEFKITSVADGKEYVVKTNSDGEAISEKLPAGNYKIKEINPPKGFKLNEEEITVTVKDGEAVIKTIKNEPIKVSVSVNKKWIGKAADSVTMHLYADDVDTGKKVVLNEANSWKHTFDNLRGYKADGTKIKYTVKEDVPQNYESKTEGSQEDGYTITNTNTEKVKIPVDKMWVGPKQSKVTVRLFADGVEKENVELSEANNWKHEFKDLQKYRADGSLIEYTVKEDAVSDYDTDITGNAKDGFKIKNTNTEKVKIPVEKTWVGPKQSKATVRLFADGVEKENVELSEANNWKHEFKDLQKYRADGSLINYTVKEDAVVNYDTDIAGNANDGFKIKNSNNEKVKVPVEKTWVGPKQSKVTVRLFADGVEKQKVELSEANNWKHEFENLPKYNSDGSEIKYTVKEDAVENYDTDITGNANDGFKIKNSNNEKVKVPVEKTWVGPKTSKVTVRLLADGKEKENAELSEANNWKHEFENLPKYNADGSEIKYTVKEDAVVNYDTDIAGNANDGFKIKNSNNEKVKVPVEKTWVGPKQSKVTVRLFADGVEKQKVELSEANNWKHEFENLPKYNSDGSEIKYTVKEDAIENYDTDITGNANDGFKIKNSNNEKVKVPVEKTWVGPKQSKVTVRLYADGVEKQHVELSAANNWKHEFKDLPKYNADGSEIKYTVKEDKVANYDTDITGNANDGFKIRNTNVEKIKIPVVKKWIGKELESVTVNLYADGKKIGEAKLSKSNGWKHTFENLPKYDEKTGEEIKYAIDENEILGYTAKITGDQEKGFEITNTQDTPKKPKTPKEPPKTGDNSQIILFSAISLGTVILMIMMLFVRRKQNK